MSDHFPPRPSAPQGADRVRDTLTALRADADRVGLSGPSDVRRRGQARGRHQAVVGLAAAVVLVAGVVTGASLLTGNRDASQNTPATSGPTASTTERPTLPADVLLSAADLPGTADGFPTFSVADREATVDDAAPSSCLPGLRLPAAVASGAVSFTAPAGQYTQTSVNAVFRLPSAAGAAQAERDVVSFLADCPARLADSTLVDRSAVGDGTFFSHTMSKPEVTGAFSQESLLVISNGDLVSVTSYMIITQDGAYPAMLQRLMEAMGRHLGRTTTVTQEPVLLKASDLPMAGPDAAWQEEPTQPGTGLYASDTCLPAYDGAAFEKTASRRFGTSGPPAASQFGVQWVYATKDAAGARSTFADAVSWITSCPDRSHPELSGPVKLVESLTGTQGGIQRQYLTVDVAGSDQRIGVGRVGNVVTIVVLTRSGTDQSDEAQLELLLERALYLLTPYAG